MLRARARAEPLAADELIARAGAAFRALADALPTDAVGPDVLGQVRNERFHSFFSPSRHKTLK